MCQAEGQKGQGSLNGNVLSVVIGGYLGDAVSSKGDNGHDGGPGAGTGTTVASCRQGIRLAWYQAPHQEDPDRKDIHFDPFPFDGWVEVSVIWTNSSWRPGHLTT